MSQPGEAPVIDAQQTTVPTTSPNRYQADDQAEVNWRRYTYAKRRGHRSYLAQAKRNESFYLGAQIDISGKQSGGQWSDTDLEKLAEAKRPAYEFNAIMPSVNAAVGYQIHNRMDIQFVPRGGLADSARATLRSKIAMQLADRIKFHWLETQVFTDGLIEQRGYFDLRMLFDTNVFGDLAGSSLDPRDVVPDPDAKSYDPRDWYDVLITRWLTLDEIEEFFGRAARLKVQTFLDAEGDWGDFGEDEGPRNKFGNEGPSNSMWDAFYDDIGIRRYRVIDRQRWQYQMTRVAIYPAGDVKDVSSATPEQLAEYQQQGAVISARMLRTVRWTVSTRWVTLFDQPSPYDRFTVIPYFCYFRRGLTRGMVDNAISPQEALNKAVSQFIHIINTTANSGWVIEENSLVSHTVEQLEDDGARTGLVLVFKSGTTAPKKIEANQIPTGFDRLIDRASQALKDVTVPDAMRGLQGPEVSGVAIQSKQFASQQQLAIPLDNLQRTRHMVAEFFDYVIDTFYDNEREFRITETDPRTGKEAQVSYHVNVFDPSTRTWSNDLTEGEYDVVVSDQPMQITFENSQFEQALELRKANVAIPDNVMVKHSNLADKVDILDQMANQGQQIAPVDQAKINLSAAQAAKIAADTVNVRVTSEFGALQGAQAIATMPAVARLADSLLKSAGFQDQDAAPIIPAAAPAPAGVPTGGGGGPPPGQGAAASGSATPPTPSGLPGPAPAPGNAGVVRPNTHPLLPAKPGTGDVGADKGIEGGGT